MNPQDIKTTVKTFILNDTSHGKTPRVDRHNPLMTSGMLDSFAVLNVVTFLEDQFGVSIKPRETVVKSLNTISDIVRLVTSKKASPAIG